MAKIELIMPKLGESIIEATILRWVKKVGDSVHQDDALLEIATDKVDSEVPSPVSGTITAIFFNENDIVPIGKIIALIETENGVSIAATPSIEEKYVENSTNIALIVPSFEEKIISTPNIGTRFYSPLVRNIAKQENISIEELETIKGSGASDRVTKKDILDYIENKKNAPALVQVVNTATVFQAASPLSPSTIANVNNHSGNVEIIEMDRMRRLIADHMVMSKHTAPHVTSFIEVDVTNIVNWRNKIKGNFQTTYNENITFTPIFMEAVVQAIKDFPLVNVSVEGTNIIVKKDINIGMATALPSGNLIVPVVKNADFLNLVGLTKNVNDLALRARNNKLKPEDIQNGTFTLTNVGTFGNVMGTPIINQPQVAILAIGTIKKKPAVIETEYGDVIAIRQMMFLSLSYDHRVVDGALGGTFLRRIGDYLEKFDINRVI